MLITKNLSCSLAPLVRLSLIRVFPRVADGSSDSRLAEIHSFNEESAAGPASGTGLLELGFVACRRVDSQDFTGDEIIGAVRAIRGCAGVGHLWAVAPNPTGLAVDEALAVVVPGLMGEGTKMSLFLHAVKMWLGHTSAEDAIHLQESAYVEVAVFEGASAVR